MRKIAISPRNRSTAPFFGSSLFGKLINDLNTGKTSTGSSRFENTDIYEENGTLHYKLELPGFTKEEIKVQTRENKLLIVGELTEENEAEERNYLARRNKRTRVKRSYPLPKGIDSAEELTAEFDNGVLHITTPIPEKEEKETVEVKID
ncbi:Hsp20/alpha crystallin family protein [Candidatus Bipolaricaulota bacterium]|nr:Hsp20/alpha crystallin family protein [Candidatus Bipolaricaulota bacterium]